MGKFLDTYKGYVDKLKNNRLTGIVIIAFIGICLLIFGSTFSSEKTEKSQASLSASAPERVESGEIEKMLSHIPGVSKAFVMISYEDAGSTEYAYNYKGDLDKNEEGSVQENMDNQIVITRQDGDEKPVVVREISPGIKGVTVIVQGTEDINLKYKIHNAVKSALGVEPHKIEVILN